MESETSVPTTTLPTRAASLALARLAARVAQVREAGLLVVLAVIMVFVGVQQPRFLALNNLEQTLQSVAIIAIVAVGETLVILTRNVDLSVGSIVGLSAFTSADLLKGHPSMSLVFVFLFGCALGALLGALNGLLIAFGRVPAIVVTLGTLNIYRGIDFAVAGGHEVSAFEVPQSFLGIAGAYILGIPVLVIIAAVIALLAAYVLRYSRQGRQLYAIGSNPDAAQVVGITGGTGSMLGAMLGAVVLGTIQNALGILRIDPFWLQAIYGAAILVAVSLDALVTRQVQRLLVARRVR